VFLKAKNSVIFCYQAFLVTHTHTHEMYCIASGLIMQKLSKMCSFKFKTFKKEWVHSYPSYKYYIWGFHSDEDSNHGLLGQRLDVCHFISIIQKLQPFISCPLPINFFRTACGLASSDRKGTHVALPRQGCSL